MKGIQEKSCRAREAEILWRGKIRRASWERLNLRSTLFPLFMFFKCCRGGLHVPQHMCGSPKTNFRSLFSSSAMHILGIDLNSSDLAPLPDKPPHQPPRSILSDRWVVFCQ